MSNLLEQASLVMIPSGYKEDVVYSEIPLNGAGDLTFTRASNGTRINSAGLVEVVPWNLLEYSQDFSNGVWTKDPNLTRTTGQTDPNGTTTAALFTPTTSTNAYVVTSAVVQPNLACTFAIYIKGNANGQVSIRIDDTTTGPQYNINYTTSWQRFEVSRVVNTNNINVIVGGYGTWDLGQNLTLAFAQVNIGSTAKPYFPTTDRLNVPRLTYQNGGGGCPSLLLEKQSTNLILQSEVFDNASWTKAAVSITANNITSPDGTQNADLLTTTSASICGAYQLISTGSGTFSFSIFAKKGNNNYLALNAQASSSNNCTAIFDLSDGTLGEYQTKGTTAYVSHKIENLGNDWYRCTMVLTATSSAYFFPMFAPLKTGNTFTSSGEVSVASGKTLYLWGCQLEASSYPTSYIPTTSSSATRVADACFKTGISSLIGQTEGTIFADILRTTSTANDTFWVNISDGTTNDWIFMGTESTGGRFYVRVGNSVKVDEYPAFSVGRHKLALAYKSGQIAGYMDGVQLFTSTATFSLTSLTKISLGPSSASSNVINTPAQVNEAIIFPTRLTNAELASLTTI